MMKKNYVTPGIALLPLQMPIGPNAGVSGEDNGGMKPIDAKENPIDDEFEMNFRSWDE
ncbi:hypothetical protein HMPREF0645_1310 [Hallella bergensis DSM 17361]|uniref:Uncharacterized protein n=1 Tax=Hallella bergensis DSM 17361 TaxID=585502 RepID=D1PWH5_9BACT|nr:hypothetical protein [Hallella bergensis]EFA44306.1 hypothetical protein HMPREF0645_1310 [Hallella bergensis DSM 17361]